jgi:hypothetical protein
MGLPRTGTTALYQTVFSGVNKRHNLFKNDPFMMLWDEPWIYHREDKNNPEFNNKLSLKIDRAVELGTTGHLVIKTHYGHLSDLKTNAPELYNKLFSIETYDIKIFRANIFESALSNIILKRSRNPQNSDQKAVHTIDPQQGKEQYRESIKEISFEINEEYFLSVFESYIGQHHEMLMNHLNLSIDDYVLYEKLPKTIKGIWENLKISSDDRFKFDMSDNFDVVTRKSFYDKHDLIKNYDNLRNSISKYNGIYDSMELTDGVWTIKGIDF